MVWLEKQVEFTPCTQRGPTYSRGISYAMHLLRHVSPTPCISYAMYLPHSATLVKVVASPTPCTSYATHLPHSATLVQVVQLCVSQHPDAYLLHSFEQRLPQIWSHQSARNQWLNSARHGAPAQANNVSDMEHYGV